MEIHERRMALDQLTTSEVRLLQQVQGLTPAQWSFQEKPDRWSIAENLEHVILLEDFILAAILKVLKELPAPEKKLSALSKEHLVLQLANTRHNRLNARAAVTPTGQWSNPAEMLTALRRTRARTLTFAAQTNADLRAHFFPHIAFGELDCYQWLIVLAQHGVRHALQIEQIKSHADYPGN